MRLKATEIGNRSVFSGSAMCSRLLSMLRKLSEARFWKLSREERIKQDTLFF